MHSATAETWDRPARVAKPTRMGTELELWSDLFHGAAAAEQFRLLGKQLRGGLTPTEAECLRLLGIASTAVCKFLEEVQHD